MLLTEPLILNKNNKNKLNYSQKVIIRCDNCFKEYESVLRNREYRNKKYQKDLCRSCALKIQYSLGKREKNKEICKKIAAFQKGKTLAELYGEEKANMIKKKLSDKRKGELNPNYNGIFHGTRIITKGKTFTELYGEEKANMIKKKMSDKRKGELNPMFGKPSPQGSGNGWSGWYKNIFFRSLLELSYMKFLNDNNIKFISGEKKEYAIEYNENGIKKNYFCDFILEDGTFIEIKPKKLSETYRNKIKFIAAKNKHENKFKIITENDIKTLTKNEIDDMIKNNELEFTERYKIKYQNYKG